MSKLIYLKIFVKPSSSDRGYSWIVPKLIDPAADTMAFGVRFRLDSTNSKDFVQTAADVEERFRIVVSMGTKEGVNDCPLVSLGCETQSASICKMFSMHEEEEPFELEIGSEDSPIGRVFSGVKFKVRTESHPCTMAMIKHIGTK